MALTELLSDGQSSKDRGAASWLLNDSGPGEALQVHTPLTALSPLTVRREIGIQQFNAVLVLDSQN